MSREVAPCPLAPWESWVPEARASGLGKEHRTLLGVALMLRRAHLEARHAAFIPAVVAWRREEARVAPAERAHESVRSVKVTPEAGPESGAEEVQVLAPRAAGARVEQRVAPEQVEQAPLPSAVRASEAPMLEPAPPGVTAAASTPVLTSPLAPPPLAAPIEAPVWPVHTEASATPSVVMPAPEPTSAPPVPPPPPGLMASSEPRFAPAPGRGWGLPISTGLGGLFYLVNVGLFLELYGTSRSPRSRLSRCPCGLRRAVGSAA